MPKKKAQAIRKYRVLTHQTHSVGLQHPLSIPITVGQYHCKVFFKPSYDDPTLQRELGGADIQIEFQASETDLVRAAALGISLIEDVLAGLSVVTGVPFGAVSLVHMVDITLQVSTPFLFLLTPRHSHTEEAVPASSITHLHSMLAHWNHLPKGGRLRRAARLYWRMLREEDDIVSFQEAYMGLEALEPLLADQIGVTAGAEETTGECDACGVKYVRRRTVLNGVRAYIRGAKHPDPAFGAEREKEWKQINALRQDLFHSLADNYKIRSKSYNVLVSAAHYLHNAICCLSHTHDLESPTYRMRRGAKHVLLKGAAQPGIQDMLEECRPILTLKETGWDPHPQHGFVPRFNIVHDRENTDIGGYWYWLRKPLDLATEADLDRANFESFNGQSV